MRTFISVPSRDLIDSIGPSTASMAPRMRTICGCCADTLDTNAAASKASNKDFFRMMSSQDCLRPKGKTPQAAGYSLKSASHRRRQPVATDADAVGLERTVGQLFRKRDHLGTGLEVGFVGGNVGHDRRIRRHRDLFLTVLVFDQQRVTVIADDA